MTIRKLAGPLARLGAAALSALSLLGLTAQPASAAGYFFLPGHPTYFGGPGTGSYCTGGYGVRGESGMFILTDGHCAPVGTTVYGTSRSFGTVAYSRWTNHDTALIQEIPGDDAYQIVVDPVTGRSPGTGRITGIYPKSALSVGTLVGKMGVTSGWTEGTVTGTTTWYGMTAYCSHARTQPGDSGGPVWRNDGGGLRAVGITVSYSPSTGDGCFIPIQDLLNEWGGWLPVFTSAAGSTGSTSPAGSASADPAPATPAEPLPALDASQFAPAVGTR